MFYSTHANGHTSSAIRIATTALTTALLVATTTMASAQGANAGATNKKALVGSWLETVTFPPEFGSPPVKGVGSFHADGTLVFSGTVTLEPPTVFSPFHGVWTHLEKRTFAYTGLHLNSDLSGNLVGYVKVRGTYVVSDSGNEYTGTSVAEIFDSGGNFIFSVEVTNAGKRIQLELP
jgi:hypothetical protein